MHERDFYAARPINTYNTELGKAYLEFLHFQFRGLFIHDPGGDEMKAKVDSIRARYPDLDAYNKDGAREVMQMFTDLVQNMHGGAGLALPVSVGASLSDFKVPAGIAKEIATIRGNQNPAWIVTCTKELLGTLPPGYSFRLNQIISFTSVEVPSPERGGKELMHTFQTENGPIHQLTIQETRERIYHWPDRTRLRPYFLEDGENPVA